jgi:hypothetical protein
MVFILGILVGLAVLMFTDNSKIEIINHVKQIINDVSDIKVI